MIMLSLALLQEYGLSADNYYKSFFYFFDKKNTFLLHSEIIISVVEIISRIEILVAHFSCLLLIC